MSICPKGRVSKSRGRMRRANSWKIDTPTLVTCPKCGELMMPHRVCRSCGSYKKQTVLDAK